MALPITGLASTIPAIPLPPSIGKSEGAAGGSFQNFLADSLKQVNSMQAEANQAVESMATGGEVNPAEVLTAVQKADLAFRLTMQIRNKLVAAYQEIQNIRI
ncbi:MAG: flagellar hook-basal body complex protein FliE [Planctomycetia bacterium]|nr:flagellar hook-basal body complex protein FliE [Planctomycetia bacterium]